MKTGSVFQKDKRGGMCFLGIASHLKKESSKSEEIIYPHVRFGRR